MRTFKLTDDCTLSGVRLRPDDRRVDGGGYFRPDCPDRLVPAHGVVVVRAAGTKVGRWKWGAKATAYPELVEAAVVREPWRRTQFIESSNGA